MKIKSFLLGSAAAMIAASAAQAADAIVVEPEPVEYVRVCDAYGSGFFYIPGTETCLRIGGYVRTTYSHSETDREANHSVYDFGDEINGDDAAALAAGPGAPPADAVGSWTTGPRDGVNGSTWGYRGRLNIDARNETEYGTLRSQLRLQGGDTDDGLADADVGIDRALISLAGFRVGYSDTYWTTNHDFGAGNGAINDGYYNFDQGVFADYTFSFDSFAITAGVQQSLEGSSGSAIYNSANNSLDWYAGINWKTDWATIAFTAINDNNAIDFIGTDDGGDMAYKVSAIIPFADTSWQLGGWYAWEEDGFGRYVGSGNAIAQANQDNEWGVWLGGNLTDNFDVYGIYTQISGDEVAVADGGSATLSGSDFTQWSLGANWQPVNGLNVQFEYTNEEREADFGTGAQYNDSTDQYQVRVVRSW